MFLFSLIIPKQKDHWNNYYVRSIAHNTLVVYLEGEDFVNPFCCYGNDVDCDLCGGWVVFSLAEKMERFSGQEVTEVVEFNEGDGLKIGQQ